MCRHECHCICHQPGVKVRHIRACCTQCPRCKRHILEYLLTQHLAECHTKAAQSQAQKD